MTENDPTNVSAAFEMLLEEVDVEIVFQNKLGTRAFEGSDYGAFRKAADYAAQIAAFRNEVVSLRGKWEALIQSQQDKRPVKEATGAGTHRRDLGRAPMGKATPQRAYRQPILQALVEMGGSGRMNEVLARVEQMMRTRLKSLDYEPLPADGMLRWSKSAQWSRNSMAREGLLADSPRGIWTISEAGRRALKEWLR